MNCNLKIINKELVWIIDIVCVYAVRGIGGLKNEAQRNVKPDLLRTVTTLLNQIKKILLILTQNPRIA